MVSISVTIQSNKLPSIAAGMKPKARAAILKTAFDVEAGWKARAPVDTGAYRASIHTTVTGDTEAEVSSPQEYGPYLEWGTRNMPARPSATPAAEAARPGFEAAMKAVLSGLG